MARIRQADVEEVKSRTNIGDIVGERVALKSAGVGSLKGLCPFHDERSPSFHVRPQVGFYHCFGCGESGDVYSFLRAMDHLSFTEAVERLAARIGYQLHYEDGAPTPETGGRSRLYAAHTAAAEFYRSQLSSPDAQLARQFLGERGFDAGAAAHFGVGYAPQGWSALRDALRSQGFSDEEMVNGGLVSRGQRGVYDRFRGRLVWPIRDVAGQTIGFGARRLFEDDQGPKYLNTPETPIYKKAQVLYGLDLAKKSISRERRVVVVEGYTDVMACHLAGVTGAIASCGTAFGSDHITVLRRVMGDSEGSSGEVVFTFDPDAAGQKAALRAFGDEKRFAAQTYVAVAPEGLDPCDLRLGRGDGAVRALIEAKAPMFEFVMDQRLSTYDLSTVEGRIGALRAAAPIVADIRDSALRPGYTRVLARKLGLDMSEVQPEVDRAARRGSDPAPARERSQHRAPEPGAASEMPVRVTLASLPPALELEKRALMGVLQYGHLLDKQTVDVALGLPMPHPGLEAVRQAVSMQPDLTRPGWTSAAVDATREPYRTLAIELLTADFPAGTERIAQTTATESLRGLRLRALDREKAELLGAMQRLAPASDEFRRVGIALRDIDARRRALIETE
ncbi:DNA primase [Microbacterium radiodurans]|uniref:DNA primase n=1 Tax=Microbacterium radiodurans TaxID=661398 RepID=A0A5J5ITA2_9MICO|nr:DNA primase [Microbacterium radiodurans]KAA9087088.1 DNA primase [Microbacterium radiodurans]